MLAVKLNARNDVNGNPRRLFLVMDSEGIIDAVEEGYLGIGALDNRYHGCPVLETLYITPGEYKRFIRLYSK